MIDWPQSLNLCRPLMHQPYVSLRQIDELVCLQIDHPKARALVALQGAQLLEYTPAGAQPVIWLSEQAEFKRGQSIRGGIPICWPWFGDARKNPETVQAMLPEGNLPAHGWVRSKPWLLDRISSDDNGVHLKLCFPETQWPAPFPQGVELSVEMSIGDKLNIALLTENKSDQTLYISQALHSYFAVSDVIHASINNLIHVPFIDTLNDWNENIDDAPICISGETDRIYKNTPEMICIVDSKWNREIQIYSKDSQSAVVWNPWIEKAKRLSQFENSAYKQMLCVETANLLNNCKELPPGSGGVLQTNIANHSTPPIANY